MGKFWYFCRGHKTRSCCTEHAIWSLIYTIHLFNLSFKIKIFLGLLGCNFPQSWHLMTLKKNTFKNIIGKGENAGNQHFLLFPWYFLFYQRKKSSFQQHSFCRLHKLSIWNRLKFCILVFSKGLSVIMNIDTPTYESCSVKRAQSASRKYIDADQTTVRACLTMVKNLVIFFRFLPHKGKV